MIKDKVTDEMILNFAIMMQTLDKLHAIIKDQKITCKILDKTSYKIQFYE
jgi:hypothetical protein